MTGEAARVLSHKRADWAMHGVYPCGRFQTKGRIGPDTAFFPGKMSQTIGRIGLDMAQLHLSPVITRILEKINAVHSLWCQLLFGSRAVYLRCPETFTVAAVGLTRPKWQA